MRQEKNAKRESRKEEEAKKETKREETTRKEAEQALLMQKNALERSDTLMKKLYDMTKGKDSSIDIQLADKLFELYKRIDQYFMEREHDTKENKK